MQEKITYDLAIIGGGLAGLSLSIQMAKAGHSVILFEKERYPFHRVCGEYISNESRHFLELLGLDLKALDVADINKVQVSDVRGNYFQQELPSGGFGISRYILDHQLALNAVKQNVSVKENTKVNKIAFADGEFEIATTAGNFRSKLVAGCFGKRSNIDLAWKRPFVMAKKNKLNNYIGVKYHIRYTFPADLIALHNFKGGYCGISRVEGGKYCLCYLTTADNLRKSNNNFREMEKNILSENPHLRKIFDGCEMLWKEPVTISQISFDKKELVNEHVLMIGDAAGMITPLCGNGMSMALHASKIAAEQMQGFLERKISREKMEKNYKENWIKNFSKRMNAGRTLQKLMLNNWLIRLTIGFGKIFPVFTRVLIKQTHGIPF